MMREMIRQFVMTSECDNEWVKNVTICILESKIKSPSINSPSSEPFSRELHSFPFPGTSKITTVITKLLLTNKNYLVITELRWLKDPTLMFWIIQGQQRRKNKPEMSINGCGLCLRPFTYPMLVFSSLNLMSESYFCQCPCPTPWRKSPGSGEKEQFFSNFDLQRKSLPVYTFDEFHSETDVLSRVLFFRRYFLFEISRIKNSFHFCLKRNWHYHDSDKDKRLGGRTFLFFRIQIYHVT